MHDNTNSLTNVNIKTDSWDIQTSSQSNLPPVSEYYEQEQDINNDGLNYNDDIPIEERKAANVRERKRMCGINEAFIVSYSLFIKFLFSITYLGIERPYPYVSI